jgi:hypothetical protein
VATKVYNSPIKASMSTTTSSILVTLISRLRTRCTHPRYSKTMCSAPRSAFGVYRCLHHSKLQTFEGIGIIRSSSALGRTPASNFLGFQTQYQSSHHQNSPSHSMADPITSDPSQPRCGGQRPLDPSTSHQVHCMPTIGQCSTDSSSTLIRCQSR